MKNFISSLKHKINQSIYNDFGIDNYDLMRFGEYPISPPKLIGAGIIKKIKRLIGWKKSRYSDIFINNLEFKKELIELFEILDKDGQSILVELVAYRLLGYKKVKLSRNNRQYHDAIEKANKLVNPNDVIDPNFLHFKLSKINLRPLGRNIEFYFTPFGVAIDYIIEQYAYKKGSDVLVEASSGDIVLDIGGCWGDTALYFADKVGEYGKVYSFEFIPNNIAIFNKNLSLNPHLKSRVELISNPVTDSTGDKIHFKDNGPGSQISREPFTGQSGSTTTITIDDFVIQNEITKIDFIKMDIEGAEPFALKGAINTLRKHRPKLAIAIYHSMSDLVHLPKWINDLNLEYDLYLDHFTIHAEETVIFAKPRN